jgi:hypothetical protein
MINMAFKKVYILRTLPVDLACAGVLRHLLLDDNKMDQLTDLPDWFCSLRRCSVLR